MRSTRDRVEIVMWQTEDGGSGHGQRYLEARWHAQREREKKSGRK